jgi:hypothetical protein
VSHECNIDVCLTSYNFNKNDKNKVHFFCTSGKLDVGFLCRMYNVRGQKTGFVALVMGRYM